MKTKVVYSDYFFDSTSIVDIATKYGIFSGVAKLHPDDKEYKSEIRGGRIALMRAELKAFKAQLKDEKTKLKGAVNLYKNVKNYKDADKVTLHYMEKQIGICENRISEITKTVQEIQEAINTLVHYDLKDFHKKVEQKKWRQ